jgi:hypothetical protein
MGGRSDELGGGFRHALASRHRLRGASVLRSSTLPRGNRPWAVLRVWWRAADDKPEENPERLPNRERIVREFYDLRAVLGMLGIDAWDMSDKARRHEAAKVSKVDRYLQRSDRCGTLNARLEVGPLPKGPDHHE